MSNAIPRFVAGAVAAVFANCAGCAASHAQQELVMTPSPATQPAGESSPFDVQQLSGQLVAGLQADLHNQIETAVENELHTQVKATGVGGDATGYRSEFGVGATLVVSLTLILALLLSHRREMLRIRQNGRHVSAHSCGKILS